MSILILQRPLFRHYYKGTDAIVFVIDSSDADRIEELSYDVIKPALQSEDLANCVLLFLANKQDLEKKMSVVEITNKLGLKSLRHTWSKSSIDLSYVRLQDI